MSTLSTQHLERAEEYLRESERMLDRLQNVRVQEATQMHTDLLAVIAANSTAGVHMQLADFYAREKR